MAMAETSVSPRHEVSGHVRNEKALQRQVSRRVDVTRRHAQQDRHRGHGWEFHGRWPFFLDTLAASAKVIVTGDKDRLSLHPVRGERHRDTGGISGAGMGGSQ
jgi:predicted nucleic acid-binding protein